MRKRRELWPKKMRTKFSGPLGENYPEVFTMLYNHYHRYCKERNLVQQAFRLNKLPPSLNHMYGRGRNGHTFLKPQADAFRVLTMEAMGMARFNWNPIGTTAAIVLLENNNWLTRSRQVNQEDADNKIKPVLDAVQSATGTPDELHWQLHVFKVYSKWKRTTVFLFDLGDIVEFYY